MQDRKLDGCAASSSHPRRSCCGSFADDTDAEYMVGSRAAMGAGTSPFSWRSAPLTQALPRARRPPWFRATGKVGSAPRRGLARRKRAARRLAGVSRHGKGRLGASPGSRAAERVGSAPRRGLAPRKRAARRLAEVSRGGKGRLGASLRSRAAEKGGSAPRRGFGRCRGPKSLLARDCYRAQLRTARALR